MPTVTGYATDFITFSRASLATVTDSDGKIKWAGHNLLTNSESFDASAWVKSSATVTANSEAAPNGTTTGDTIAASGANGTALQSYTALAVPYTFGVWLKRKTGTGTIEIAADNGTYTAVTITSSWALYTVTQTPAAGSKSAGIRIVTSGDEVYLWGAHLYRSDLGGMVANTSAYPMYNPTTPKNLLGYTESFDNAAWTKINSSIVANSATAPNGLQTADKIFESTANAGHSTTCSIAGGGVNTLSVYAKAAERNWCFLYLGTLNTVASFNLETGVVGTVGSAITASIVSAGGGWYRCSITGAQTSGSAVTRGIYIGLSETNYVYAGDGVSGIYVWGAQLSDSASLDTYTRNNFAAPSAAAYYGPRLDYDPVTLAAKGLLVEEQRTNLLLRSAEFDNASWSKTATGTGSAPIVTANVAIAPDGTLTADQVDFNAGSGTSASDISLLGQSVTVTSATAYNGTFYVKAATPADIGKTIGFRHVAATAYTVITLNSGWTRVSLTETSISTTGSFYIACRGDRTSSSASVFIWGAQLEAGSFATSYIPTTSASITRSADVASVATSAFPVNETEGAIIVSCAMFGALGGPNRTAIALGRNSSSADLHTVLANYTGSSRTRAFAFVSTTLNGDLYPTTVVAADQVVKMGYAYKKDDFGLSLNGAPATVDTIGDVPTSLERLAIGQTPSLGANYLNGHIRQITYIPRRLTNAELQARTA